MGLLRFLVPRREDIDREALQWAYWTDLDEIPWRNRMWWAEDHLVAEQADTLSSYLHLPWRVPGHGRLTLSTATLIDREAPYLLPVEIARGTLNRLRNQWAAWEGGDFTPSRAAADELGEAQNFFAKSAVLQHDPSLAADLAQRAIEHALVAMDKLTGDFADQALSARQKLIPRPITLLGANPGTAIEGGPATTRFVSAFNTAAVPFSWRDVERVQGQHDWSLVDRRLAWCQSRGLRICAGPLIRLAPHAMPDWLYLWEDDFDHVLSFFIQYMEQVVARYRGRIHVWHAAAGLNVGGALSLSEEQRLRLAATAIDILRRGDPHVPIMMSVDQPWGEHLTQHEAELSPWNFADALARAELGLTAVGLEIHPGFRAGATLPRDPLEFGRQIDRWSGLGLPLAVMLSLPNDDDKQLWTAESQRAWIERYVQLVLARSAVQMILWDPPQSGADKASRQDELLRAGGKPTPALTALTTIRQRYLRE
jgi:hypothetical protein